ncbi:outer membrane beta-barrel protein [Runella salmonicolor]|uniref:Outer membrane beta-barrel protein n=1 Tax=Runella salmonicolor TaxID=2950278 RepID=A0ABT1FLU8_9BACT|nr:outer membrane beta-barrel protein [Runella salmonicolor]MCP1382706.1 outer membrane beta-barrel protein [Runella salmonicolor]
MRKVLRLVTIYWILNMLLGFSVGFGQQKKPVAPVRKSAVPVKKVTPSTKKTSTKTPNKTTPIKPPVKVATQTKPLTIEKPESKVSLDTTKVLPTKQEPTPPSVEQKQKTFEEVLKQEREEAISRKQSLENDKRIKNSNRFGIGIQASGISATLTTTGIASENKKPLLVWQIGLRAEIPINSVMSIQTELNYANRGIGYAIEQDYDRINFTYVDLPILLKFSRGNVFKIFGSVGGYGGYWLKAKLTSQIDDNKTSRKYDFDSDINDGYADNRFDYGAIGNIGISANLFRGTFFVEGRYIYGLSDVSKLKSKPDDYNSLNHRVLGVNVGYLFSFD